MAREDLMGVIIGVRDDVDSESQDSFQVYAAADLIVTNSYIRDVILAGIKKELDTYGSVNLDGKAACGVPLQFMV